MVRTFRGRWAAAWFFFATPGAILACCRGGQVAPPLYWQTLDFDWQPRPAVAPEPFAAFDAAFVSALIPGHFATPAPAAAEGERDKGDTGFRRSLTSVPTNDSFPSQLDGALIDVTATTSQLERCDEAILDFERAVEAHAQWLSPIVIENAEQSGLIDLPQAESREIRFPLASEVWDVANPPEELASSQRWLMDAGTNVASPRRLVFVDPSWETDLRAPIEFDRFDSPRSTETVERIWPTRPIVATLVVSYFPSWRCGVSREMSVHRFPLALLTSEP